jgi:hypothetical protein
MGAIANNPYETPQTGGLFSNEISPNSTGDARMGSGNADLSLIPNQLTPDPSELEFKLSKRLSTVNLSRTVFDKNAFNETVDTTFSQLGETNPPDPSFFDVNLATQADFWTLYDKFFFEIPKEGDTNSHAYLAQTSADYANYDIIQQAIEALLDEIAELRETNVELRVEVVNSTISASVAESALATAIAIGT